MSLLLGGNAFAYVRTTSESGNRLYWSNPSLGLFLNPSNSSGLSADSVTSMIQGAFQAWNSSGANVSFSLNSSTGNSTSSAQDFTNRVFFSTTSGNVLDWGVIAVTQVYYYRGSGQIIEADLIFNDRDFRFTNVSTDTGVGSKIYLQDVATHEAGHAYGLDHTTVGKSSLIYRAFAGQAALGEDDKTAVNTIYPGTSGGGITGTVKGTLGGIFGTHVLAINVATGKVQAGTLAESDGTFRIGNIPAGDYIVEMEPFYASPSTISSYYNNVDHKFCGSTRFKRSFYGSCGNLGVATTVNVGSGDTNIGTLSPSCTNMGNPGGNPTSVGLARSVSASGGGYYGTISAGISHYYRIQNFSGDLNVRTLSWSLYSAIDQKVEILNSDGSAVAGAVSIDNVENPMPGGKTNYDSRAYANGLPLGDYLIKVTGLGAIGYGNYPAGSEFVDSYGFYLVLVGANGQYGTAGITDMSSCVNLVNRPQGATITAPKNNGGAGDGTEGGCGGASAGGTLGFNNKDDGSGGPPFYSTSMFLILITALLTRLYPLLAQRRLRR